jgi:predicted nucleic acid-binding protein
VADEERVALDTSVIVSALFSVHERHAACRSLVAQHRGSGTLILPVPAMEQSYSVLTRLPTPLRLDRRVVGEALRRSFHGVAELVGLDGPGSWSLIAEAVAGDVIGGATHDFHIAACARRANATALATFNRRHFERFDLAGLRIVVPGDSPI